MFEKELKNLFCFAMEINAKKTKTVLKSDNYYIEVKFLVESNFFFGLNKEKLKKILSNNPCVQNLYDLQVFLGI